MENERRTRRRQIVLTVAAIGALVGLVIAGLYVSDKPRRLRQAARSVPEVISQFRLPGKDVDPSEVWITRSEGELRTLHQRNEELDRRLDTLGKTIENIQRRQEEATQRHEESFPLPMPLPARAHSSGSQENPLAPLTAQVLPPPPVPLRSERSGVPAAPVTPAGELPGILVVDVAPVTAKGDGDKAARHRERHTIRGFIPAGTFASATLLSGIDAPTGGASKTNPQPVLLRLIDRGTLPNRFRSRVRACFVTAAGYGDLSAERAYLRLEKLSCVMRDETVLETTVKGYVTGEDGKAGMRGRVVSKQGQMIARSLLAGVAGGIGEGISQSYTSVSTNALGAVSSVDPGRIAQYGVAQGFGKTLDRIAQWYLDRANETYPIVEVDAGRTVEVVLSEGLELGMDLFAQASDP